MNWGVISVTLFLKLKSSTVRLRREGKTWRVAMSCTSEMITPLRDSDVKEQDEVDKKVRNGWLDQTRFP